MHEQLSRYEAFQDFLRRKRFAEAAGILIDHCTGLNLESITEILTAAHVVGSQLDLTKLTGVLSQRRRRIGNAIEGLKSPAPVATTKQQRKMHNTTLRRRY